MGKDKEIRFIQRYETILYNIKTDRFYNDEEKIMFLRALKSKRAIRLSHKLDKKIKQLLGPDSIETRIKDAKLSKEWDKIVDKFYLRHYDKRITYRMIKEEFSKPRRLRPTEIRTIAPDLVDMESREKRTLTTIEIIDVAAKILGFDKEIMINQNIPRKSLWQKLKGKVPRQQLLSDHNENLEKDYRKDFLEDIKTEEKNTVPQNQQQQKPKQEDREVDK